LPETLARLLPCFLLLADFFLDIVISSFVGRHPADARGPRRRLGVFGESSSPRDVPEGLPVNLTPGLPELGNAFAEADLINAAAPGTFLGDFDFGFGESTLGGVGFGLLERAFLELASFQSAS